MIKLPESLREKLSGAPESSYGVVRVTVVLKTGERIPGVDISWDDEVLRCLGKNDIPFTEDDIADIEIPKENS